MSSFQPTQVLVIASIYPSLHIFSSSQSSSSLLSSANSFLSPALPFPCPTTTSRSVLARHVVVRAFRFSFRCRVLPVPFASSPILLCLSRAATLRNSSLSGLISSQSPPRLPVVFPTPKRSSSASFRAVYPTAKPRTIFALNLSVCHVLVLRALSLLPRV